MSKIIPTLPTQGSQRLINVPGSTPNGGVNPKAGVPVMSGWKPHNAVAASGQQAGAPQETVATPKQGLPGQALPNPATAVPGEVGWTQEHENQFVVAGRDA